MSGIAADGAVFWTVLPAATILPGASEAMVTAGKGLEGKLWPHP